MSVAHRAFLQMAWAEQNCGPDRGLWSSLKGAALVSVALASVPTVAAAVHQPLVVTEDSIWAIFTSHNLLRLPYGESIADRSNARTAHFKPDVPLPTLITINPDRTFSFSFKTPPVSYLLKKAAKIDKGTGAAGSEVVGEVSLKHVYEIAKVKCLDEELKMLGEERVARSILGSAKSLGINVVP